MSNTKSDHRRLTRSRRRGTVVKRATVLGVVVGLALLIGLVSAAPVSAETGDFIIKGRGWGHAVGMSQWGAWQAAREGETYDTILAFYYPGSTLSDVDGNETIKVRISRDPANSTYGETYYRVYLKPKVTTATLLLNGGESSVALDANEVVETVISSGQVRVVGHGTYDRAEVVPDSDDGRVAVSMQVDSGSSATSYREYWGSMIVRAANTTSLRLVNRVSIDKYSRGVTEIKPEWAKPSWPQYYAIEAVKAQAVSARTYSWAEALKNGYVNDDTRDICYKGYTYTEDPSKTTYYNPGMVQAAIDTNGKVLLYDGELLKTYFSSHSGGYTSTTAWGDNPPTYLVSKPDPWSLVAPPEGLCSIKPGYAWTKRKTADELRSALISKGYIDDVGTITKVEVISRDTADEDSHALYVRVTGTAGSDTISARSFRYALGLRSTLFWITKDAEPTRYEQDDTNIAYGGAVRTVSRLQCSEDSHKVIRGPGAMAVTFEGTQLAWIARKGGNSGIAKVTVDGDEASSQMVDLYSATAAYQSKVYDTGVLDAGEHTVTIEWTGTKNSAATRYLVSIDAFDVMGTLKPASEADVPPYATRYEEDESAISYTDGWVSKEKLKATDGHFMRINSPGSVTVEFEGTFLAWIGNKGKRLGKAQVTLDAGTGDEVTAMVDLYSYAAQRKRVLWTTGELEPGTHTVTIEWTGKKRWLSRGTAVIVDAFDVMGTLSP